ncbi:hypothetical protein BC938DRAFT_479476, partial [Jimgerdemannia flammicorona]
LIGASDKCPGPTYTIEQGPGYTEASANDTVPVPVPVPAIVLVSLPAKLQPGIPTRPTTGKSLTDLLDASIRHRGLGRRRRATRTDITHNPAHSAGPMTLPDGSEPHIRP